MYYYQVKAEIYCPNLVTRGGREIAAFEDGREFPGQDPRDRALGQYISVITSK